MINSTDDAREGPRILIIDDERLLRKSLQKILEKVGFQVETALDYQSAKKKIRQIDFDIILVDIILPQVNGIELIKKIKNEIENFNSAVIFITGEPNLETVIDCLRLGASDYLIKPVHREVLIQSIKKVIIKKRIEVQLMNNDDKRCFVLDDSFINSNSIEEMQLLKNETIRGLNEIHNALVNLKMKFGNTFNEEQKSLLNIVAKNNNNLRKIWNV